MAPPALAIVGGVVVVAGVTIAFHHFIYEPHIAPKIELFIENWLEQRRPTRRRLASVSVNVDSDDSPALPMKTYSPGSQTNKHISIPLKSSLIATETTTNNLRRRVKSATVESVIETPNNYIPFDTMNPVALNASSSGHKANVDSRSSTPSTISSSILAMHSPSIHPKSPRGLDAHSDHSHGASSLADSILTDAHDNSPLASPVRSVTHISPRTLFTTLSPTMSPDGARSLALVEGHTSLTYQSAQESFSQSPQARSPNMSSQLEVQNGASAARSPPTSGHGQLLPGPRSNASWSDISSSHEDDQEALIGSDGESWAHLSDRA